ncbi:hypothetical protein EUTSA_v10015155mg [Eutrema salsugineum]|uniref:Uncharacterized protein n=1 Tax=Eutrema salsugineum TaxID=72664 RepID=V4LL16_EUTSA|nr:uncharacterized protein LOC18016486 [Eutrema salsugineum]ESQ43152.1 hypothetical protein EUTSA_v10015155mg [Eutrema salsugineum]
MPLRINPLSLLFLTLLIVCSSSFVESSIQLGSARMHERFMLYKSEENKGKKIMSHRKLMFHSTADYDDAGPNPKHDPRRRPGGKP